jgi:flagella basal body P-ring formation protein FlgA
LTFDLPFEDMELHLLFGLAISACFPVAGDRILMRDLTAALPAFASADAEQIIGFAPAPGAQRRLSAGEVSRLAASNGVANEMVEPVCFERKLTPLTKELVTSAMRASLPAGAEFELLEFSHVRIPEGTLEFSRNGLPPARPDSPRDPVIWRGSVKYAAAQNMPIWAKARVWISIPSVIAAHDLSPGKPIEPDQIRMGIIESGPYSQGEALSAEQVVGLTPRRPIRAGQPIPSSAVETPVEVERGEMVGLEARFGGALLKLMVRAEKAGRVGDAIPVRNVESGKGFQARIIRKGWVAVE